MGMNHLYPLVPDECRKSKSLTGVERSVHLEDRGWKFGSPTLIEQPPGLKQTHDGSKSGGIERGSQTLHNHLHPSRPTCAGKMQHRSLNPHNNPFLRPHPSHWTNPGLKRHIPHIVARWSTAGPPRSAPNTLEYLPPGSRLSKHNPSD